MLSETILRMSKKAVGGSVGMRPAAFVVHTHFIRFAFQTQSLIRTLAVSVASGRLAAEGICREKRKKERRRLSRHEKGTIGKDQLSKLWMYRVVNAINVRIPTSLKMQAINFVRIAWNSIEKVHRIRIINHETNNVLGLIMPCLLNDVQITRVSASLLNFLASFLRAR